MLQNYCELTSNYKILKLESFLSELEKQKELRVHIIYKSEPKCLCTIL